MRKTERVLYQFPISHYCEKTRWNLDAKGLSYTTRDLIPGAHRLVLWRLTGTRTVPVLVDRSVAVGDSTAIAAHLERGYPERPLLPADVAARARALELEAYFTQRAGFVARQWIYGALIQARPGSAMEAMSSYYPLPVRLASKLAAPFIERELTRLYGLTPEGLESAEQGIQESFDRIERETGGDPTRYLVGEALTLADIAAASLLAPLVMPKGSPYEGLLASDILAPSIRALRERLSSRPGWAWILERYANDRRLPARA